MCCRYRGSEPQMTTNPAAAFLLVQDKVGYKYDNVVKHMVKRFFGTPQSTSRVLRGELLKEYHHEEKNYNYVLQKDPSVFLRCADEEVAPLLTQKEFMLLQGIEKRMDRFEAFTEGMLDLGSSLKPGSGVFVTIYNEGHVNTRLIRATVHYIGEVEGYHGFQFGVELKEKIEGGHHGTVSGFTYFQCEDGYGKIVPLNRLVKYTNEKYSRQSSSSSQESGKTPPMRFKGNSSHNDGPSNNTRSRYNLENQQQSPSTCKIGDRVRFYNKEGQSSEGTVKWIGMSSTTRNFDFVYVGILTDNAIYTVDYDKSQPGLSYLISAPNGRGLFIPESMVDKIGQKESKKDMEESVATKLAEEMHRPKHEILHEQHKFFEEVNRNKEQKQLEDELKRAGVSNDEVNQQVEQFKRIQEEKSKETKGTDDGCSSRQAGEDPNNHRPLQQSKSYDYQKMQHESGDDHEDCHFKEQRYNKLGQSSHSSDIGTSVDMPQDKTLADTGYGPSQDITIDSIVQIPIAGGGPCKFGIVRWIGSMPNVAGLVAGIELDEYMDGCSNGCWEDSKGKRYQFFACEEGKGLYYPVNGLLVDTRIPRLGITRENPLANIPEMEEHQHQHRVTVNTNIAHYVGEEKGIQGHQNSCYLDATVFGLFSLSHEFDEMFLRDKDSRVGQILWQKIVNPLRMFGVVKYDAVMELRKELDQLGKMGGITHAEKDPEEFLNFMFKNSLKVKPFIKIRRPFGIESEYFVQLFIEFSESTKPGYIGTILNDMFKEQNISFTQVPSKLLIQVPRHGKKFQSFQKTIPELILNISEVTDSTSKGKCFFCGKDKATVLCEKCHDEFGAKNRMAFCDSCFDIGHTHKRTEHEKEQIGTDADLELLSVLCIETSHYVCFTKSNKQWLFFDSMFDRKYDQYNIPRVQDVSRELNDWVYPDNGDISRLLRTNPRELPECVRRFTQDIYLCVYIQKDMSMY